MEWYNYLAAFFAGAFLSNVIPHFVNGISGNKFPTPFSKPPGQGLSSPMLNVVWAAINLIIGFILLRAGKMHRHNHLAMAIFFVGFIAMALILSKNFSKKHEE